MGGAAALLLVLVAAALIVVIGYLGWWFTTPVRQSFTNPPALSYKHQFRDPKTGESRPFPSISDPHSVDLSLIAPAYNEEKRIKKFFDETLPYLDEKTKREPGFTYEIIIVDDGSSDKTSEKSLEYAAKRGADSIRVLTLAKNQGKGGAVQQGMLHARGKHLLMVDADAATDIRDLDRLIERMRELEKKSSYGVVVGSRAHLQEKKEVVAKRTALRTFLMHGFHWLVYTLAVKSIRDTQCGFKLFTRDSARVIFSNLNLRRWCFDVEVLFIAESLGMPLAEVYVNWEEIPGSKLRLLEASLLMGRDLVIVRVCYTLGVWIVKPWTASAKNEGKNKQR